MSSLIASISLGNRTEGAERWRALRFFNLYRLVIAGLLCVLGWQGDWLGEIDTQQPALMLAAGSVYLLLTLLAQGLIERRRPRLSRQVFALALLDIVAITLVMYGSGGVNTGIGMLLVVALAGACLLTEGETAALLAAMATSAILVEELSLWWLEAPAGPHFAQAGMLGVGCFATALLAHGLSLRVQESEALAARRGVDLANLERLNAYIVGRMQSGILVVDAAGQVRLINEAAQVLTGDSRWRDGEQLSNRLPELAGLLGDWLASGRQPTEAVRFPRAEAEALVSFTAVGPDNGTDTLIFIEDASAMHQRAQGLKLASLGRLTASIAHEVRNPLGAISYAAQLLKESSELSVDDQRLTTIINEQSNRVNRIIENVLSIGRRESAHPDSFFIGPWLRRFVDEFRERHRLDPEAMTLQLGRDDIQVRMDATQLHQVLWNLTENALRYSVQNPRIALEVGLSGRLQRPWLDVSDTGPGITTSDQEHIFEPFFTSETTGTGLGLYLARELCEANQAELQLLRTDSRGSCFRIQFAHPERRHREASA